MGLGITNFEHEAIVESWTTIKSIKNTLELLERNDIRTMNSNIWDLKYSINYIKGQTSGNNGRVDVIDNKINAVNENLDTVNENIGKIADFINNYFNNKDNCRIKDSILELLGKVTQEENKESFDSKVNEIKTLVKYL